MTASVAPPHRSPPAVGPLLHVFMHGRHVADLSSPREGRARLTYLPGATETTYGLSCCLPAAGVRFSGATVTNWLAGLLPDRSEVLARWRARYSVRRQDAFALLWHVGEDVPGAARFVRPGRVEPSIDRCADELLTDEAIGRRISDLTADAASWEPSPGFGQFSLAGAQAKFALARTDRGWVEPSGSRATTHIFKPAIPGMVDQDLNEHLTMRLAAAVGLPVAPTSLVEFAGARTLVVARFDRYERAGAGWRRVHQEDAVQALGLSPALKYEAHGGPGVGRLVGLLRENVTGGHAEGDVATFLDAVAFNWLTVGTDAHARNYALMHHGGSTRLAPLYDLNSFLPYLGRRPSHLALRIGFTQTDPALVTGRDWEELARDCGVDADGLLARVAGLTDVLMPAAANLVAAAEVTSWRSPLPQTFYERLGAHVTACAQRL